MPQRFDSPFQGLNGSLSHPVFGGSSVGECRQQLFSLEYKLNNASISIIAILWLSEPNYDLPGFA